MNRLAREQMKLRLLTDIRVDLEICDIEGWDKEQYIRELQDCLRFELKGNQNDT